MPVIDLTAIPRILCTSLAQLEDFAARLRESRVLAQANGLVDPFIGFDTETTAEEFPAGQIVGFSLYYRPLQESIYVPLRHEAPVQNIAWVDALPILQALFDEFHSVAHGWQYDGPYTIRDGIALRDIACTLSMSAMLQAKNIGLKDQVMEYRLVDWRQVKSYYDIVAEARGISRELLDSMLKGHENPSSILGFNHVNVASCQTAVDYACNDAIWCRELYDVLVDEHSSHVGDVTAAAFIRQCNDDTSALLAESAAQGYLADGTILATYIANVETAINQEEQDLLHEIDVGMGWATPEAPANLFDAFGVTS